MQIAGKTILITGASQGIGAALARLLKQRGANLSLSGRRFESPPPPDTLVIEGDITQDQARRDLVTKTIDRYGRIDVLINNAGVGLYVPTADTPLEEARRLFEVNLFAPLALAQLAIPHMKRQGGGTIVNVSSVAGKVSLPWFTLYSASKFALLGFTDGLRIELSPDNIHVMAVCPGYVSTKFQQNVIAGAPPEPLRRSNAFRITPDQCAQAIVSGIERNARTVVTPGSSWFFIWGSRLFPGLIESRLGAYLRSLPR